MKQLCCCIQRPWFICFGGNQCCTAPIVNLLVNCAAYNSKGLFARIFAGVFWSAPLCPLACLSLVSSSRKWKRVVVGSRHKTRAKCEVAR